VSVDDIGNHREVARWLALGRRCEIVVLAPVRDRLALPPRGERAVVNGERLTRGHREPHLAGMRERDERMTGAAGHFCRRRGRDGEPVVVNHRRLRARSVSTSSPCRALLPGALIGTLAESAPTRSRSLRSGSLRPSFPPPQFGLNGLIPMRIPTA